MSLEHAILGFVHERPRSGYDLKKAFDQSESGQAVLRDWLASPLPLTALREAFLIQFFWADAIPSDELVELLEGRAKKHKERLEFYYEALRDFEEKPPVGVTD